mmetsp:Transcript_14199/g.42880  ORF Transcript_14199/g.42880 Transcript_14199/m.42880 type:complete len:254 (-) Transcript_14199:751-1512(-)
MRADTAQQSWSAGHCPGKRIQVVAGRLCQPVLSCKLPFAIAGRFHSGSVDEVVWYIPDGVADRIVSHGSNLGRRHSFLGSAAAECLRLPGRLCVWGHAGYHARHHLGALRAGELCHQLCHHPGWPRYWQLCNGNVAGGRNVQLGDGSLPPEGPLLSGPVVFPVHIPHSRRSGGGGHHLCHHCVGPQPRSLQGCHQGDDGGAHEARHQSGDGGGSRDPGRVRGGESGAGGVAGPRAGPCAAAAAGRPVFHSRRR